MKRKIIWIFLGLLYLIVFCFYLSPILARKISIFYWWRMDLNKAKDYYGILTSFNTLILGTAGLILGYFYYKDKNRTDQSLATIERKRKRLDDLIDKIDLFDSQVDALLQRQFKDENELFLLRNKIIRSFETIEIMLELNEDLLGLHKEDLRDIIKVNSFVEKNDLIMRARVIELTPEVLHETREEYIDLIQNARRACFRRVC
jgi:hypothetical protein